MHKRIFIYSLAFLILLNILPSVLLANEAIPYDIVIKGGTIYNPSTNHELDDYNIGIIDSKKHKGMVVSQPDIIENFAKVMETNLLGDETLMDIFELRLILEMGMVDLVFARKTEEDLIELGKIVDKMEKGAPESNVFSLQNEVAFHGKLYDMSGNKTLQRVQHILLPVFKYVHDYKLPDAKTYMYAKKFISHRHLLNYLIEDDKEKFRKGLAQHLEPHFDRVLKTTEF